MKKIININLSGRVIPIEDSAYEKLQAYIESLRRYFASEEGRDEIINDIESRVAELMNEKTRKGSSAISDQDVEEIIASMGRVEDFETVEEESIKAESAKQQSYGQQYAYTQTNTYRRERGRLYRDSSDKILGGVCSGIANYLDIDPAIIRILFAIISFGGGFGFLAYIILWIILPTRDLEGFSGKRLYRNPDERVIGGVSSGLAAYFDKSVTKVRLIFAAPILLNILFSILDWPIYDHASFIPNILIGSFTGTFIFVYIVLWIVLPEANSEYQKMEMRGEKVDVNRIRQNVQEGMGHVKDRMKEWGEEVKGTAQQFSGKAREFANTRGREFVSEAGGAVRRGGRGIGHVIGVLFKAFFLFIFGTIAFALFVALIGILIGGVAVWPIKDFLLTGFWQNTYAIGTLILFLGVPVVAFIVWLLRRIMRVRSHSNYLGWTFGGLWLLGWVAVTMFVSSLVNDFRMSNNRLPGTELNITQPADGKMIVKVSEPELEYSGEFPWITIDGAGLDFTHDTMKTANIRIEDVALSDDSNYHVIIKKYSRGRTIKQASELADQAIFNYAYNNGVLDLGSSIAISKESKFRGQQVRITIKVPAGRKIRFDNTLDKLHSFNMEFNERRNWRKRRIEWDNEYFFPYATDRDYLMGMNGELKDEQGNEPAVDQPAEKRTRDGYRNPGNDPNKPVDTTVKAANRTTRKVKANSSSGSFAIGPSPVSSMTQWF